MTPRLTDQQLRVGRLVAAGHTDQQIAAVIERSVPRVRQILGELARLLGVDRSRNLRVGIARRISELTLEDLTDSA